MGYKFQFVTLAGFHALNYGDVRARAEVQGPRHGGLLASSSRREFAAEAVGYSATRHQREVGTGYFDQVAEVISGGKASTLALEESTEAAPVLRSSSVGPEVQPARRTSKRPDERPNDPTNVQTTRRTSKRPDERPNDPTNVQTTRRTSKRPDERPNDPTIVQTTR